MNKIKCENCEKEHDGSYGSGRFCSSHCARSFSSKTRDYNMPKKKLKKYPDNFCEKCGKQISHRNNQKVCKDCRTIYKKYDNKYYYVKDYRKKQKEKAVDYKGGKCIICGYDKCKRALDFHHIKEEEKEFSISQNANKKWESVKKELDKCVLVCANCHRELHDGMLLLEDYIL